MLNSVDFSGRPFHFIGIGGIGMSALAHILVKRKLPVSGSDVRLNHITQKLQEAGAHIFWSQDATNLTFFQPSPTASVAEVALATADRFANTASTVNAANAAETPSSWLEADDHLPQVVCSTAIRSGNPEYRAAVDLGCPIFHRSDLLAALIHHYKSVAVAGTHGKTTTSSLIAYLLLKNQLDPTIIIGGEVSAWEGNAHLGEGDYLVAEADESDGTLAKLSAYIGVVTNIELDHPDHYASLDDVIGIFKTFQQSCDHLVGCLDCDNVKTALQPDISYSLNPAMGADYTVDQVVYGADGTTAQVWERGKLLGLLHLQLLGRHNLSNALAAVAVGRLAGLEFDAIAAALASFEGARRRFECRGIHHGITFIDDYAHHPSELKATLAAARLRIQSAQQGIDAKRRIIAVFQPHRYSRTRVLMSEFAEAFQDADQVILTDIYGAGEANPTAVTGEQLATVVAAQHDQVAYHASLESVYQYLTEALHPGDVVLFLGAGNLNQIIPDVMEHYHSLPSHDLQDWGNLA
jgi:UDP-N-acetylmuramate--alanine ligase